MTKTKSEYKETIRIQQLMAGKEFALNVVDYEFKYYSINKKEYEPKEQKPFLVKILPKQKASLGGMLREQPFFDSTSTQNIGI